MGISSLLQWFPGAPPIETTNNALAITPNQWRILADAKHKRLPLILYSTSELTGTGYQSLVLKINSKSNICYIDMPHPALPSDHMSLPRRIYATLKCPGAYQHWQIEGSIIERAHAGDGPYFIFKIDSMRFCQDRRRQTRFNLSEEGSEVSCTPPMEPPIYGNLENISMGGICFAARGNLQQSDAFYLAYQGKKSVIPASIQLNIDERLQVELQILSLQVIKKPYLHTLVRARFKSLSPAQTHILAALTEKLSETA